MGRRRVINRRYEGRVAAVGGVMETLGGIRGGAGV